MTGVRVRSVVDLLDERYPPALAESWDSVGLVCGDPDDRVTRVLVCVDATEAVVDEALRTGVQLIVAHHPLLLRGVDSVAADTPKGVLVHRLIRGGCALYTAHTNADSANPGVSDALAALLGVRVDGPLDPQAAPGMDKWSVFVPEADADRVLDAMFAAGAGHIGDYSRCAWRVVGTGQFLPMSGADPAVGAVGEITVLPEHRVEFVAAVALRGRLRAALHAAHPYEEPAYDVLEPVTPDGDTGLGRVGSLDAPMTLRSFVDLVADRLPTAPVGIRAAGDPDRVVARVAVCGGAGDSLIGAAARAGVDVYVTGDLRHHPVDDDLRAGGPALVDAGHWATEFPWCRQAADLLIAAFDDLEVAVTTTPTDPFTLHRGGNAVGVDDHSTTREKDVR
ncbi:Nif3-like dinuclear metal center hexameric protein [Williamsia sterculiae]|uniref:GTP cyclohydrolase 1 type 2 homolog n=1 Tax=Williamsia sterculiae TaxID=1344003 RepID=A0A1N7G9H6_9NOCA|nr:Nif3-like dinuclear metal center hexameric protein [Williamsia sterculiae]SIS09144.1 dinuclear metal center protein, YbgI/SA1388 family [Williamsia sterculiae]